ncbi:hypothetical protein JHU38_05195 [Prevotella sp. A2931]|uniref:Tetratricopeptide repeat protein n=1 Tax=Prevotella illustrans TaxID=2800387 RepID=A0ABS3M4S2_9BACT|nr:MULTISPECIES: hypothetical protein [Prevotella]MBO1363174.1 hypothetical protein [Prevotella illustrans]PTL25355.1 hypothetical protein C3V39_11880 [Prevotella sp. oral taxon 820]
MIIKNKDAQQRFDEIREAITARNILSAIDKIRGFQSVFRCSSDLSVVDDLESDYRMMLTYYRQGIADHSRERIFENVQKRLLTAYANLRVDYLRRNNIVMTTALIRIAGRTTDVAQVRNQLEEFVSDLAMLSLGSGDQGEAKRESLFAARFATINHAFNYILTSHMWNESEKQDWTALILTPTIDVNDSLVLVSAVMMACLMQFDLRKLQTLMDVYAFAADERLRQRSLVGWVLSLSHDTDLYPEQLPMVRRLLEEEHCRQELGELGLQIFYCMDADKDSKEIQRDIMPGLIRNSNLKYSDRGFVEKDDEDSIEDILHPDLKDKAMEELEKGYQKMMEMQRRGSDIYFGGFAQMKRYGFFYSLVNWFMPYYTDHPDLKSVIHKLPNTRLLDVFVKENPFCDSDKYSFTLALSGVIDKLPKNVLEMLERGELQQGMSSMNVRQDEPRYVRQTYLQDLYRFFRLFMQKEELPRAFSADQLRGISVQTADVAFFMDHPVFSDKAMDQQKKRYVHFFLKRHMMAELERIVDSMSDQTAKDYLIGKATLLMGTKEGWEEAEQLLRQVLRQDENDVSTLRMLGKLCREKGDDKVAVLVYERLMELFPDKRAYLFNLCLCLEDMKDARARKFIFELIYKFPEDLNAVRLLAWDFLQAGEFQKALTEYEKVQAKGEMGRADFVNMGYCHWFLGEIEMAVDSFRHAVVFSSVEKVAQTLDTDAALISQFVTNGVEISLMKDLIRMAGN